MSIKPGCLTMLLFFAAFFTFAVNAAAQNVDMNPQTGVELLRNIIIAGGILLLLIILGVMGSKNKKK